MRLRSALSTAAVKVGGMIHRGMMAGAWGGARPYQAASHTSAELGDWYAGLGSADSDYLYDRDTIVARTRDLIRNSGWAAGAVTRHIDNVIGTGFRLSYKPDYVALVQSEEWANEFEKEVEGRWRIFAEDPDNWIDASRQCNFNGLLGLAYRHDVGDGESLSVALWLADKPGGRYATTIQIIDPDRLSNPNKSFDTEFMRAGIELNENGAPIAYHIQSNHPADMHIGARTWMWERVPRETPWGRQRVIHTFERERAGQTRGVSLFAPILERLKMIDKYDKTELQAAVVNAIFAAYIVSPFDHELIEDMIDDKKLDNYQAGRKAFHDERQTSLAKGTRIPTLFPGEDIKTVSASRPSNQFGAFERACLRNIASAVGLSYEQLSQDWSSTNYSSARAALLEVWRHLSRKRDRFAAQFATPIFALWFEEAVSRGDLILPDDAPDFYTAKAAWLKCKWIGGGRGWVDPVKEAAAVQMRLDMGVSTLEDECAEQGRDWRETLSQRAIEIKEMDRLRLPRPAWANTMTINTSSDEKEERPAGNG